MLEKGVLYVTFEGPIAAGKDTVINRLRERERLNRILKDQAGAEAYFLKEGVNHDPNVLAAYYADPANNTGPFELASLSTRIILARGISDYRGIAIGNRSIPEARATFVRVNAEDMKHEVNVGNGSVLTTPFMTPEYVSIYDSILRSAVATGLPTPDLVFLLEAPTEVLWQRKEARGESSERAMRRDYMDKLNRMYGRYKRDFAPSHSHFGMPIPRLVVIDATTDMNKDKRFLDRITRQCEQVIAEEYTRRGIAYR